MLAYLLIKVAKEMNCTTLWAFRCIIKGFSWSLFSWVSNLSLKNYVTSEEAVSHNVLYYEQLSIAHYQVSFYANSYFE